MKLPSKSEQKARCRSKRIRHANRGRSSDNSELLRVCLQKICELQADLESEDVQYDAQAAGYAACATEALRFLTSQGLSFDHPMVKTLIDKLINNKD